MTKSLFICWSRCPVSRDGGRDFYDQYPIVKETIESESGARCYDLLSHRYTEGQTFNQTRYTQRHSSDFGCYLYRLARKGGYQPYMVAGLSRRILCLGGKRRLGF